MTAASDARHFQAEYVPPPPPAPGRIWVIAPVDARDRKLCPDLHLLPEEAEDLRDALSRALAAYMSSGA